MDPQEITEGLGHPGARNLLDSATLLRLAYNAGRAQAARYCLHEAPGDDRRFLSG
jgi:hypothetical protein